MINMFAALKGQGLRAAAERERTKALLPRTFNWEIQVPGYPPSLLQVSTTPGIGTDLSSVKFEFVEHDTTADKSTRSFLQKWMEFAQQDQRYVAEGIPRDELIEQMRGYENFEEIKQVLLGFSADTVFWREPNPEFGNTEKPFFEIELKYSSPTDPIIIPTQE